MCGICGIIHSDPDQQSDQEELIRMRDCMAHRGPDGSGIYVDGHVGLCHRRLSIIDVESGQQPMSNEDKTVWVVFNGEIYNFKDIRNELIKNGHNFKTVCDTEILVHLYEDFGPEFLNKLQGMFSFAIWDSRRNILFAARDRLGIKPFYYILNNHTFYFASEIKALLHCKEIFREINYDAILEFLTFRFVSGSKTLFKDIKSLIPGHALLLKKNTLKIFKYWSVESEHSLVINEKQALDKLDYLMEKSIRCRLMSDVPLGTLNSGGVDSSLVTAYASEMKIQPVNTYSVVFDEFDFDESSYAEKVSKKFGTHHHTFRITSEEFARNLPLCIWHNDEPLNHANSVPIYLICNLAKNKVTVLLTGEGADEIFGGYPRYWLLKLHDLFPCSIRKFISAACKVIPGHYSSKLRNYLLMNEDDSLLLNSSFQFPKDLVSLFTNRPQHTIFPYRSSVIQESSKFYKSLAEKGLYMDLQTYLVSILQRMDRMSMAARVEARVPFLDHELVQFAMTLPQSWKLNFFKYKTKTILKKLAIKRLPNEIVFRKKSGFGIPVSQWLRDDKSLGAYLELLTSQKFQQRGIFRPDAVKSLVEEHRVGSNDHGEILWELINLELWFQLFIDRIASLHDAQEIGASLS